MQENHKKKESVKQIKELHKLWQLLLKKKILPVMFKRKYQRNQLLPKLKNQSKV